MTIVIPVMMMMLFGFPTELTDGGLEPEPVGVSTQRLLPSAVPTCPASTRTAHHHCRYLGAGRTAQSLEDWAPGVPHS